VEGEDTLKKLFVPSRFDTQGMPDRVLLNAQWRGGSTITEQLIFSTTASPVFLLDEPAAHFRPCAADHRGPCHSRDDKARYLAAALSCDWSNFDAPALVRWQHWRGVFSRLPELLDHDGWQTGDFSAMRARCDAAGIRGGVRAAKLIRGRGLVAPFARACAASAVVRSDFARVAPAAPCLVIELVRHPVATLRSQKHSKQIEKGRPPRARRRDAGAGRESRVRGAQGVSPPRLAAGASETAGLEGELEDFCAPILEDVRAVRSLQRMQSALPLRRRRRQRARRRSNALPSNASDARDGDVESGGAAAARLPRPATRGVVLTFQEVVTTPRRVAHRMHRLMGATTNESALESFVEQHFGSARSDEAAGRHTGGGEQQLLQAYDTYRPRVDCVPATQPMDRWSACAELGTLAASHLPASAARALHFC